MCPSTTKEPESVSPSFDRRLWTVVHVTDGDTIIVTQRQPDNWVRREKVRLLQINTPEKGQPLYDEAREALKEMVKGGEVALEFARADEESRDGYGRLLATVFVEDTNLNVTLVRMGMSAYWTKYGKSRKYDVAFRTAEEEARAARRGIWQLTPGTASE